MGNVVQTWRALRARHPQTLPVEGEIMVTVAESVKEQGNREIGQAPGLVLLGMFF